VGAGILLILIVAASLVGLGNRAFLDWALLRPFQVARSSGYVQLITSGFVHADFGHLIFNLITFYSFAFPLERAIGTLRFLILYVMGLLISDIGTCIKHRNDPNYASLGASGAILAVLFAAILYFPRLKLVMFPLPIPIPGPLFAVLYLAFTYYSSRQSKGRINHDAHLAGALTGVAFVAATDPQTVAAFIHSL
jgi:membrane associated rhomboid family serine protease